MFKQRVDSEEPSSRRHLRTLIIIALFLAVGLGELATLAVLAISPASAAPDLTSKQTPSAPPSPSQPQPQDPECGPNWTIISSPNASSSSNFFLTSVTTLGDINDVWAVGYTLDRSNIEHTLIEHGWGWTAVVSPDAGSGNNYLSGVAAASSTDVWAVGAYNNGAAFQTLIEHWDGTAWAIVTSPNQNTLNNVLSAVTVVSADNVWAVGYYGTGAADRTLIEHWDGSSWSIKSSANQGTSSNYLYGVAASSSTDVWAVGYYNNSGVYRTLAEHWDGNVWSVTATPNRGGDNNRLTAVTALSSTDAWAVGYYFNKDTGTNQTLVLHWVDQAWLVVGSPNQGSNHNFLFGVTVTYDSVWASGYYSDGTRQRTLIEKYDGASWSIVSSPNQGPLDNNLVAMASPSAYSIDAWAVGEFNNNGVVQTLMEVWNGMAWTISPGDNVEPGSHFKLNSVAASAPDDVWAVGSHDSGTGADAQTLVEHWNGSAWSIMASPNHGTGANELKGVAAVAADDVWAVGSYYNGTTFQTLIERYNGTAWSVVSSGNVGTGYNALNAVAAAGPTNIWAAGYYSNGAATRTLVEHWDGLTWHVVVSPNQGTGNNLLSGVAVAGNGEAWAVGDYYDGSAYRTLIEHYTSVPFHYSWVIVPGVDPSTGDNFLAGVTISPEGDVWAVGYDDNEGLKQPLAEHWNASASQWNAVSIPDAGGWDNYLFGVAALASNAVYAVGYIDNGGLKQTLVEQWDGTAWSVMNSANSGIDGNVLNAVAVGGPGDIWVAGDYDTGPGDRTLVERYTPCLTCTTNFTDVPWTSPFYQYVHCLTCRAIINGYADGNFRVNSPLTRGQLSKMVSNAAGFDDTPTGQQFQDLPPGSTFYPYVYRLASRGYISGYACGEVAWEPCVPPDNLPYFHSNMEITRGQTSKIVSEAAGFNDPPGAQLFEDVAPGTAFYTYTQRLASRGVMSGYPCGGAGYPCAPPASLPYFRPNANITRGQSSKIVSKTFFPDCTLSLGDGR